MSLHVPVLVEETLRMLHPQPGQVWVDATLGGGGYTRRLAESVGPKGQVVAVDRDPQAVHAAERWVAEGRLPIRLAVANFADLPEILGQVVMDQVDGIVMDLGLSTDQLADNDRGFSFRAEGPLDLRFDPTAGEPAFRLLDRLGERHLADLIFRFGEERYSRRIAKRIVETRQSKPIRRASELADIVQRALPATTSRPRIHPATRTFQALRIAVNDELKWLEIALRRLPGCLGQGGKIAVISFHSLEDRLVKHAFREDMRLEVMTRKPIRSSPSETAENPRSRSARLRVARRQAEEVNTI